MGTDSLASALNDYFRRAHRMEPMADYSLDSVRATIGCPSCHRLWEENRELRQQIERMQPMAEIDATRQRLRVLGAVSAAGVMAEMTWWRLPGVDGPVTEEEAFAWLAEREKRS